MKKILSVLVFVLMYGALPTTGRAQEVRMPFKSAEDAFRQFESEGRIISPLKSKLASPKKASKKLDVLDIKNVTPFLDAVSKSKVKVIDGSGEMNILTVHQDMNFLSIGKEISHSFIGTLGFNQQMSIYGADYEPGPSGQFDENGKVTYFQPNLNEGMSYLPYGIRQDQYLTNVYQRKLSPGFNHGENIVIFLVVGANGQLLQQTRNYFYSGSAGPDGLPTSRIDSVVTEYIDKMSVLVVKGHFPTNSPLWFTIGKPVSGVPIRHYDVVSADGTTVLLQKPFVYNREIEADLTLKVGGICYTKVAATIYEDLRYPQF